MSTEEKNPLGENKKEQKTLEPKKTGKFMSFVKNNKAATFLTILLLAMFIYFSVKIKNEEKQFENEKTQLITKYETERDSLKIKHLEFASTVFSWSVRSELLRNNTENLNQLLTIFVQESKADLVELVDPTNKMVLLSSDKKFEGNPYLGNLDSQLTETTVVKDTNSVKIITPVMGFNSTIGILIVESKK